jgi:hypothetical protein
MEKSIIDYAMDEDGVQFRNALYASIQDKVTAHIEAAKQSLARNLISTEEVSDEDEGDESLDQNEAFNQDSVQKLQAKIDASSEKEVSHAKSLGWNVKNQTYGREYTHPKHGHIAMNRYGEWQHKPESSFKGGKGQLIAHGQADDLDKHLSSLNK